MEIHAEVSQQLLDQETILISSLYELEGRSYGLMDMWQHYCSVHGSPRLVMMGWGTQSSKVENYLCVQRMPNNLPAWVAAHAREPYDLQPDEWPHSVDTSIINPIRNFLLSHGDRTLHRLLIHVQELLMEMEVEEGPLAENMSLSGLSETAMGQELRQRWLQLRQLWQHAQPYFALMPEYPHLQAFLSIDANLEALLERAQRPDPLLSDQITDYLEDQLTEVVEFYDLEPSAQ